MFLRAGFNRRFKTICQARALHRGRTGIAYLIQFKCGDLVWLFRGEARWDPPAMLLDLIDGPPYGVGIEQSRWPRKDEGP